MFPNKNIFETNAVVEEKLVWNKIKFQSEIAFEIGMRIGKYYVFSNVCSRTPLGINREKPWHFCLAISMSVCTG